MDSKGCILHDHVSRQPPKDSITLMTAQSVLPGVGDREGTPTQAPGEDVRGQLADGGSCLYVLGKLRTAR